MTTRTFATFSAEVSAVLPHESADPNRNGYVPQALALVGRYSAKHQPTDLVKAAAALYLLWREHGRDGG